MILYEGQEFNDYHHSIDKPIDKNEFMLPSSQLKLEHKQENEYVESELKQLRILHDDSTIEQTKPDDEAKDEISFVMEKVQSELTKIKGLNALHFQNLIQKIKEHTIQEGEMAKKLLEGRIKSKTYQNYKNYKKRKMRQLKCMTESSMNEKSMATT